VPGEEPAATLKAPDAQADWKPDYADLFAKTPAAEKPESGMSDLDRPCPNCGKIIHLPNADASVLCSQCGTPVNEQPNAPAELDPLKGEFSARGPLDPRTRTGGRPPTQNIFAAPFQPGIVNLALLISLGGTFGVAAALFVFVFGAALSAGLCCIGPAVLFAGLAIFFSVLGWTIQNWVGIVECCYDGISLAYVKSNRGKWTIVGRFVESVLTGEIVWISLIGSLIKAFIYQYAALSSLAMVGTLLRKHKLQLT
jgi:hypothetical protein